MSHNNQKKIAVINDFSGFGRCSISVSLPIISALKVQCCPVPTSVFSNHTGFESFYSTDFTSHLTPYINEWKKLDLQFGGILSGYLGSVEQIDIVKDFLKHFGSKSTVNVIDTVMGDNGRLYPSYSPSLAEKMAELVEFADILTPNLTEACILTDTSYREDIADAELFAMCQRLSQMGAKKIVISGLQRGDDLENYVFEKGKQPVTVREHKVGQCRSGTGDVFASIITADAVNGVDFATSVKHASSFIAKTLRRTAELKLPSTDGICFEEFLCEIGEML